ncbi:MAG: hypothetical protein VX438_15880 [Planctomycetota bacterium]|nr:hypothetical protein [Planctomycetota bacterium]
MNIQVMEEAGIAGEFRQSSSGWSGEDRRVFKKPGDEEVGVRIYFEIVGSGQFQAGAFCTESGVNQAWVKPRAVLPLTANADPSFRFSHWIVGQDYAGATRTRRVVAQPGLRIKAVFVPLDCQEIR